MRFWLSGEIFHDINDDFTVVSKELEFTINAMIKTKKYGKGLKSWDVISIILPKSMHGHFREVAEYDPKTRECEFRLHVDYTQFKKGSCTKQRELFCQMLRRTLEYLAKWEIPDFAIDDLKADFEEAIILPVK